jgi:hypothetical protein
MAHHRQEAFVIPRVLTLGNRTSICLRRCKDRHGFHHEDEEHEAKDNVHDALLMRGRASTKETEAAPEIAGCRLQGEGSTTLSLVCEWEKTMDNLFMTVHCK